MSSDKFDEARRRTHILICTAHANTLGLLRAFGEAGVRPVVILAGSPAKLLLAFVKSRYVGQLIFVGSVEEAFRLALERWGDPERKNFLHIMYDYGVRVCDSMYDRLASFFYVFNGGRSHSLSPFFEKGVQCKLAERCGLRVPKSEIVTRGNLPETLRYPIYVKCTNPFGAWKDDMEICHSPEELLNAYGRMKSSEWIMQEYVNKQFEVSLQGISINGGREVYMPYKKTYIRLRDKDYGTYMHYERNDLSQELNDGVKRMLWEMGYSGCFEAEFLLDEGGNYYFLEINLRYSASNQGMLIGGVNLPMEWAAAELAAGIDDSDIALRDERYYIMNEPLDIEHQLLAGRISLWRWLGDFFKAKGYFVWKWTDPVPAAWLVFCSLGRAIRNVFGKSPVA